MANIKTLEYKISVIIPCYNQGKFLDDAVNSVLKQTYQNFEIIVINDGSTDKYTNDLLKNYNKPKTKVYITKNQGLASTRNYGFELSDGEFIQFLDADDTLAPNKFEKQINIFRENNSLDVSYTNYTFFYEDTGKYSESQMQGLLSESPFEDFVYRWQRGISIPIHCGLFKRKVFNNEDPFISGFKAVEDWIMWIAISSRKCKFSYLDEDLAVYRIQQDNMTKDKTFMFYWVSRAVSYIAQNFITSEEMKKFNMEQEKYLEKLINAFFLNDIKGENTKLREEVEKEVKVIAEKEEMLNQNEEMLKRKKEEIEKLEVELTMIKNSKSYRLGKLIAWLPRRVMGLIKR